MRRPGVFEAIREANLAAGFAIGRGSRRLTALVMPIRLKTPTRLLIAPQDLRSSDATIAADIFAGHLTFAGRRIEADTRSPFEVTPPNEAFARELHGFAWLRHARAAESDAAREAARGLMRSWLATTGRSVSGPACAPVVIARRVIAWITQSPLLLEGADEAFYRLFIKALHRQAGLLLKARRLGVAPRETLPTLLALSYYALSTDRSERLSTATVALLLQALRAEILPDGGHISRNPQALVDTLLDLLPLQQAFAARSLKLPAEIPASIARMIEMLRLLRHQDGALGLFNGMGLTEASQLAALLAYGSAKAWPLSDASYSGYQRMSAGNTVLLVDAGRMPPARWSSEAHAGCLSFELSSGGARFVVNCGRPPEGEDMARHLARSTAAHSTLVIADTSSCRFVRRTGGPLAGRMSQGPRNVTYGREASEGGEMLVARHDGYERAFGLLHQRSLFLTGDGTRIEGRDQLLPVESRRRVKARKLKTASSSPFALRFHLHPAVRATLAEDRRSIRLKAGDANWLFEADAQTLAIEDSIFFATRQGRQRSLQIVIEGLASAGLTLNWSFALAH